MDFPAAHLSLPMEAVPPSVLRHSVANCATRSPLSPHCNPFSARYDSLGVFHPSRSVSLASFANRVSGGDRTAALARAAGPLFPHPPASRKAGYVCTQRYGPAGPMHRAAGSISCFVRGPEYHTGSTSAHKNRSPRKQGRHHHAIGKRPESASAGKARLPPSTHPKLGVSSRHQRFHRCALQRIFSPSFGDG